MKILIVHLSGRVYWSIGQTDLLKYSLRSFRNWYLINPLIYSSISLDTQSELTIIEQGPIVDNSLILTTNALMFEVPDEFDLDVILVEDSIDLMNQFMIKLRSISQQVHLAGVTMMSIELEAIEKYPEMVFPKAVGESWARHHIVDTAITLPEMEEADSQSAEAHDPPVFHVLLLDSIQALEDKNYRTAILYAAMSMETVSATKLDEAYKASLSNENNPKYRVVKQTNKGKVEKKDPIFEHLSNRTSFRSLLHEQPLYLLERSLLVEDKPLYDEAVKLYGTRSKIVHRGELPEGQNEHFEINEGSARAAIKCATRIFDWFGQYAEYTLPSKSFVRGYAVSNE